jgi:hypothetical protein
VEVLNQEENQSDHYENILTPDEIEEILKELKELKEQLK